MPRHFLHMRDRNSEILDSEGTEIEVLEEFRERVLRAARELMIHNMQKGALDLHGPVHAEDGECKVVCSPETYHVQG